MDASSALTLEDMHRATLNILEDIAAEREQLHGAQRAVLNILEDSVGDRALLEDRKRAALNMLEDMAAEKAGIEGVKSALVNILEDFEGEKGRLESMQRCLLNILEDSDLERTKGELAYRELHKQIGERARAEAEVRTLNEDLQRRASELTTANRELEAFSYSVAHDLRAPLRSIAGFSAVLLKEHTSELSPEGREHLELVVKNSGRMAKLIEDLLNFSRVGRAQLTMARVDMEALAKAVALSLTGEEPERHIRVAVASLPPALGDANLLRQVLFNLLANAFKFTRRRPEAVVEVGGFPQGGSIVYFVKDNGEGFDPRYGAKLFGVFQRLHTQSEFEGTGIGLAIVHRIIERHEGRVWADSEPARGAAFYFSLTAAPEKAP